MSKRTNVKRGLCALLVLVMSFTIVGCGANENTNVNAPEESVVANTIGTKFVAAFNASKATAVNDIVDELMANVETPYELAKMDVEEGYLNGFDDEIKGFDEGVVFSPMIGSIPFVGYVFKSADPKALEDVLTKNANLRWNICTEADEMVSAVNGDLVFFMMCTNED